MNSVKPLVILLAEDNEDHAELMLDTLRDFNVRNTLVHAQNGEIALQYLRKEGPHNNTNWHKPDLILLDIKMPKLDGIGALSIIKNDAALKHIPVVMISTSKTEHEIDKCFAAGANSYITKPLQFDDFTRKIKDLNLYWVLTSELPKGGIIRR